MFCISCSKLSFLYNERNCIKCYSKIINSLAVLCDSCSLTDKVCSICVKKINPFPRKYYGGCGSCGGK